MCGIFGVQGEVDETTLARCLSLIDHRGPDSSGSETLSLRDGGKLTFQHTRLAIQDLSANGHQPMQSQCGRWLIVFNGEIYNHRSLRRELTVSFRGDSDTETIIEYIACFGIDRTLQRLNGIYGMAIFDRERERLFLVRDPYGVKPVYYRLSPSGAISFCSEIKPLTVLASSRLDARALGLFLSLRYTPSPHTLLEGIQRLLPGHLLEFDCQTNDVDVRGYFQVPESRFDGSLEEAVEAYHDQLQQAVSRQLIADVPVGILLSGGIDSALLASLLSERPDMTGYTVGFSGDSDDCEIDDAAETARILGVRHRYVRVDPVTLLDDLPAIIRSIEEPLGTTSVLAMWQLVQLAREDVTVALAGQGSDEPWGGYRRYKIEHLLTKYPWLCWPGLAPVAKMLAGRIHNEGLIRGLNCLGLRDQASRFRQAYALFGEAEVNALLPRPYTSAEESIQFWLDRVGGEERSSAERMMRVDMRMNLADDLLLYGDKISMAFALELRVPMLDLELLAFVDSLPLSYRADFSQTKIVHKLTAERYLPTRIVHRPKKGFQVPFGEWSKGVWKKQVEERLLDAGNPVYAVLDRRQVERLWRQHCRGERDLARQIFSLLSLTIWAEEFAGG